MALQISSLQDPTTHEFPTLEVIGVPLRRRVSLAPAMAAMQAEVERLRELVEAKNSHIATLETQVWAWRSQAHAEGRARREDRDQACERERDLVRILHHQVIAMQDLEEREHTRRRWWMELRKTL